MGHAEKVRAQWEAQPKDRIPKKKNQQVKFKNTTVADRKYSRAEVNTLINKLKEKLEEEKRERAELNAIVRGIEEPMEDAELEAILNEAE